jgi:hypothetical protein
VYGAEVSKQTISAITDRRSRPVVRIRAGTSSITSVNDFLPQVGSTQRHRRLCHTSEIPLSP